MANEAFMVTSVMDGRGRTAIPFRRKLVAKRLTAMPPSSPSDVTRLLREWAQGDREALNQLVPLMYAELRQLAHHRLRREPANHSVNTTGLVHDAYLKLIDVRHARFQDRAHFLAMASRVMRRVLIDQARARRAAKRGGGADALELDEALWLSEPQADALTDLDDALKRLEALDPRQGEIVEQRYFGGLSLEETAEALGVSLATVKRELRFAHAWLASELGTPGGASGSSA
jgi:RNA polymerase sigma factor (TIGR02999 family)